jgi:hypothetical protein
VRTAFQIASGGITAFLAMMVSLAVDVSVPLHFLLPASGFVLAVILAFKLTEGLSHERLKRVLASAGSGFVLGVVLGSVWSSDAQGGLIALFTGPAGWLAGAALGLAWLHWQRSREVVDSQTST